MFRNNEKLMMFMFLVLFFGISGVGSASAADVPVANFTSNATQGMAPLSVQFNDTSIGNPTSWNWNFGDGINSTLQNPTHAYKTAGTYNVTLTASNSVGSNTLTQNNYIAVIPQIYSSYLGGSSSDQGYSITVGKNGNIYITGRTSSTNFPTTNNAYQTQNGGGYDAFLSEFNSNGSLIYSTYLGGNNTDSGNSVAIDNAGNVYITGSTTSTNFPTTSNAYQTQIAGGENVFLSEFNSSGSIIYSTYLGGSSFDTGKGIALDKNGNIYLTGETSSLNFPITSNAYQTQNVGVGDVFLTEFNSNKTLIYSTYLGGSGLQYGYGVAVDNSGNAYITGYTSSSNFPITSNAYQKSPTGTLNSNHAFISEFDLNGNLIYSSYLGGNGGDYGYGIAVDNSGNTYITGYTTSNNFPITSNAYQKTYIGSNTYDAFLSEFNSFGNLIYSTYLGGSVDIGTGITVDNIGNVYITGYTSSPNFPITNNAYQKTYGGSSYDAFLSEFNSGGNLIYSTFIGGNNLDYGYSVAVDNTGNTYITGYTVSTNFPTTSEAYQTQYAGGTYDGFIVKLKIPAAPITSFTANTISGTAPLNIQFNDTSSNSPTSWLWTFGDGESSTQQNPTYTYNTPGKYTVTLTATNADGNNTITMNNLINVIGPVADNTTGLTYITIGAAVNAANNGDTILVNGGNYIENVILNKNLILEASGQVNIIPLDSTQPVFLINNSGSGSTIQGFTITGSTNSGIYINNATGNTILNNTLLGNNSTSWGICIVNSNGQNNITGNNVTNCIEGINLYDTTGANITYNTAISNVYDGIALTYSNNNTITNNNGTTLNVSGIRLNNSNNNTVTNNNLTGNIWTSISLVSSQYNRDHYQHSIQQPGRNVPIQFQ